MFFTSTSDGSAARVGREHAQVAQDRGRHPGHPLHLGVDDLRATGAGVRGGQVEGVADPGDLEHGEVGVQVLVHPGLLREHERLVGGQVGGDGVVHEGGAAALRLDGARLDAVPDRVEGLRGHPVRGVERQGATRARLGAALAVDGAPGVDGRAGRVVGPRRERRHAAQREVVHHGGVTCRERERRLLGQRGQVEVGGDGPGARRSARSGSATAGRPAVGGGVVAAAGDHRERGRDDGDGGEGADRGERVVPVPAPVAAPAHLGGGERVHVQSFGVEVLQVLDRVRHGSLPPGSRCRRRAGRPAPPDPGSAEP